MTHRNLFSRIAITTSAALIGLAGATAQAEVHAGNYQTHVLPSTTRHTADRDVVPAAPRENDRVAKDDAVVRPGDYQDYVVSHSTRHSAHAKPDDQKSGTDHEVALSNQADRR